MDLALIMLIGAGIAVAFAFIFCFFGYRWARFLLPICGLIILEGIIYIFVYGLFNFNELGIWLFFGGSSIAIYIILFFFKRLAGFFAGLLGSALILLFAVYAFDLQAFIYLLPICLTICVIMGVLAIVYQKSAVIISTSLFGACIAALLGLYIVFEVLIAKASIVQENMAAAALGYLSANALLVCASALGLAVLSILIQLFSTGHRQVLAGEQKEDLSFYFLKRYRAEKESMQTEEPPMQTKPAGPQKEKNKSFGLEKKDKTDKAKKKDSAKKSFRMQR